MGPKKKLIYVLIIFFPFFGFSAVYGGNFILTPANYATSGMSYATSGTASLNTAGSFSALGVGNVTWTIFGYNLKSGQQWKDLKITLGTGGTYDLAIYSTNQTLLYSQININSTSFTLSLSKISGLENGAPFYLQIVLTVGQAAISQISITYTGNELVGFPAPYQISSGSITLVFDVEVTSKVSLEIYDNRGRLVKTIMTDVVYAGGANRYQNKSTWNGKDESGRVVNTGVYTAVVRVTPTTSGASPYVSSFRVFVLR